MLGSGDGVITNEHCKQQQPGADKRDHACTISEPQRASSVRSVKRMIERRSRTNLLAIRTKNERAISLARPRPLCSDFRRSGSASRHKVCRPESLSTRKLQPAVSSLFHDHTHCKSLLLPSVSSCPDRVSLPILGDDRYSALSFWKITLPLKAILLSAGGNASGSCDLLLWK